MSMRKNVTTGVYAGVTVCTLILACNSSTSPASPIPDASTTTDGSTSTSTPAGTTPVTAAGPVGDPYPVCATLQPGSYLANGSSYAVPTTTACSSAGGPTTGAADTHCQGVTPQTINGADCDVQDGGPRSERGRRPDGRRRRDRGGPQHHVHRRQHRHPRPVRERRRPRDDDHDRRHRLRLRIDGLVQRDGDRDDLRERDLAHGSHPRDGSRDERILPGRGHEPRRERRREPAVHVLRRRTLRRERPGRSVRRHALQHRGERRRLQVPGELLGYSHLRKQRDVLRRQRDLPDAGRTRTAARRPSRGPAPSRRCA